MREVLIELFFGEVSGVDHGAVKLLEVGAQEGYAGRCRVPHGDVGLSLDVDQAVGTETVEEATREDSVVGASVLHDVAPSANG